MKRQNEGMKKGAAIRLLISISGVMFLFGLTWLFGALTITVTAVNLTFQILFVVFNSFQGFFIFLFFCVFSKEARESWKEVLCCGRYQSKFLHPSQNKYTGSGTLDKNKKSATASTAMGTLSYGNKNYSDGTLPSKDTLKLEERYSEMPMTSIDETKYDLAADSELTDPYTAQTFKGTPESERDTDIGAKRGNGNSAENGNQSEANGSESLKPLKARVKRYSTKKVRQHHVEKVEVDFSDSDSTSDEADWDLDGGQDMSSFKF